MRSIIEYITEKMVYNSNTSNDTNKIVKEFYKLVKKRYNSEIIFSLINIGIPEFKMNNTSYEVVSLIWDNNENYITLENSKETYEIKLDTEENILTFVPEKYLQEVIEFCINNDEKNN